MPKEGILRTKMCLVNSSHYDWHLGKWCPGGELTFHLVEGVFDKKVKNKQSLFEMKMAFPQGFVSYMILMFSFLQCVI